MDSLSYYLAVPILDEYFDSESTINLLYEPKDGKLQ